MTADQDYSLLALTVTKAAEAQELVQVLTTESDTFTIGSMRDGEADFDHTDDDTPAQTWLLQVSDTAIGIASVDRQEVGMAILHDYQNQGLGQMTLAAMIEWAKRVGLQRLWLDVQAGNDAAIHIYQKAGFLATGEQQALILPNNCEVVINRMELNLG